MDIKAIRESLKDHPHVKKVWVCENGYTTVKRAHAVEVDLSIAPELQSAEIENTITQEEKPVKPKKKK